MKKKYIVFILLVSIGIFGRTVFHIGPNIEFVTAATLLSSLYLNWKYSAAVPFFIMAISDLIIGNSSIFIFTWSAYIVTGLLSAFWYNANKDNRRRPVLSATLISLISSLWFFIWTNFGVWFLDSWGMYSNDIHGLVRSYAMGLPFLRYNFFSNLLIVPISVMLFEKIEGLLKIKSITASKKALK